MPAKPSKDILLLCCDTRMGQYTLIVPYMGLLVTTIALFALFKTAGVVNWRGATNWERGNYFVNMSAFCATSGTWMISSFQRSMPLVIFPCLRSINSLPLVPEGLESMSMAAIFSVLTIYSAVGAIQSCKICFRELLTFVLPSSFQL